jgi:phage I-like protein
MKRRQGIQCQTSIGPKRSSCPYKERYSKLLAKLEEGEQQQEAHTLTGGAAKLDGVSYPETLAKAKVIAEFHE